MMMKNRVSALRAARSLTQRELEARTGIERSKLSRIESGDRKISGTEAVFLAEALSVAPEELYETRPAGSLARFRGGSTMPPRAAATAKWFRHFVDDALFVDRTARRYGIE